MSAASRAPSTVVSALEARPPAAPTRVRRCQRFLGGGGRGVAAREDPAVECEAATGTGGEQQARQTQHEHQLEALLGRALVG